MKSYLAIFVALIFACCATPALADTPETVTDEASAEALVETPTPEAVAAEPAEPLPAVDIVSVQESFSIQPLAPNVFAALAKAGGMATTNAMFVIGKDYVIAAGAHMTRETIKDLYTAIAARTDKPVKYFILTHHHSGYNHIDFDFPAGQDVLMSWQTWRNVESEVREAGYPIMFFNEGLTLKAGDATVIMTNIGKGHTDGDLVLFVPEAKVVFASDLLYVDSVGYMGNGYMTDWLMALDFLEQLGENQIIPGYGPVTDTDGVYEFGQFFREFLTLILNHIEKGESLDQLLLTFDMPRYDQLDGYEQFIKFNLKRAYQDLKKEFGAE